MKYIQILLLVQSLSFLSCNKLLNEKPDIKLKEANSLADLNALLNYTSIMNYYGIDFGESSADNYYIEKATWESLEDHDRQTYVWGDEIFYQFYLNSWLDHYKSIYNSNHVLERLSKIPPEDISSIAANEVKGKALFFRAYAYFRLVSWFSKAYDKETSTTDLGIPLRLSDDFNIKSVRASVAETYRQILEDLNQAKELLPDQQSNKHIPSKQAAYILLSWVYLATQDFENASLTALKSLEINNVLLDYSTCSPVPKYPFAGIDGEIIFILGGGQTSLLAKSYCKIDSSLYDTYSEDDYRKQLFFGLNTDGSAYFRGNYLGNRGGIFMGLSVADAYLNLSEALIRLNREEEGLEYLHKLLEKRYITGKVPVAENNSHAAALKFVLDERRKEFVMRGTRWTDIKRLNKIDPEPIIPKRKLDDLEIFLPPNDNRYALPLPAEIIEITGMPQNPR